MIYILITLNILFSSSLQQAYDEAPSLNGYDKYVLLDPNVIYNGGLGLYEGNVMIDGQGASIDLQSGTGIWVYGTTDYPCNLDIKYCSIINGEYDGLNYAGLATGNVENCNFINNNIGVKLMDESIVDISNSNFINNTTYGLAIVTEDPICNISYCNSWNNGEYDFMENCPGWGNIWTPWEPQPGIDLIYEDPLFIDLDSVNFSYSETSPCIDTGNPAQTDPDGSIRDIGANIYSSSIIGDCNNDDSQNVIDIIYNMNNCILEVLLNDCGCSDLNQDNEYNILDVVMLVNIILEN